MFDFEGLDVAIYQYLRDTCTPMHVLWKRIIKFRNDLIISEIHFIGAYFIKLNNKARITKILGIKSLVSLELKEVIIS